MALDKSRDLAMTSSVLLLVLLYHTEAAPFGMKTDLSKPTQLETKKSTSQPSSCSLQTVDLNTIEVDEAIHQGSLPVKIELNLLNYSADFLNQRLPGFFVQPNTWFTSYGESGLSLLLLKFTSWNSLRPPYLIVLYKLTVTLIDVPNGCLRSLSAENTALVIRNLLLNDFRTDTQETDGEQSTDARVCNQIIKENEQSASFVFQCCEKNLNGDVACEEAKPNFWLNIIIQLYTPIFIVLYLFSPTLMVYFLDFDIQTKYLFDIFEPALKPFRFVYTNDRISTRSNAPVCTSHVKGEERFKCMSAKTGGDYKSNRVKLIIKSQRLITQQDVPVGMFMLVHNLFKCRFRHIRLFEGEENEKHYCDLPLCCNSYNFKVYKFFQVLLKLALLHILALPLSYLCYRKFHTDEEQFEAREKTAKAMNVTFSAKTEKNLFYVHVSFLCVMYLFLFVNVFGYPWKYVRPVFKKTFQSQMDNNSTVAMRCIIKILRCPFKYRKCTCCCPYMCYCFLSFVPILISRIMVSSLYHLISHLSCNLCCKVNLDRELVKKGFFVFIFLFIYYDLAILTYFMVSLFFSILIGIIIFGEKVIKICTAIGLLLTYGRSTFHEVWQVYMEYHKSVFDIMIKIAQSTTGVRSSETTSGQENNQEMGRITSRFIPLTTITTRPISRKEEAMLNIEGMFLIVDERGQFLMPVEFFYKAIEIKSCLAPGPVDSKYFNAFVSYMKIVLFLAILFMTVLAFRDIYRISLIYELFATVAAGLIPLIFNQISSNGNTIKQIDADFEKKLRAEFAKYKEDIPIFDLEAEPVPSKGVENNVNSISDSEELSVQGQVVENDANSIFDLEKMSVQGQGVENDVNSIFDMEEMYVQGQGVENDVKVAFIIINSTLSQHIPQNEVYGYQQIQ